MSDAYVDFTLTAGFTPSFSFLLGAGGDTVEAVTFISSASLVISAPASELNVLNSTVINGGTVVMPAGVRSGVASVVLRSATAISGSGFAAVTMGDACQTGTLQHNSGTVSVLVAAITTGSCASSGMPTTTIIAIACAVVGVAVIAALVLVFIMVRRRRRTVAEYSQMARTDAVYHEMRNMTPRAKAAHQSF